MKNNRMKDALENIARGGVPENTNLWPRISAGIDERKSFMKILRARPLMIVVIAVVALLLLTGVVYAIGKVTGFIPGVGLVDQSAPLRVLAEPVTEERDGITITIQNVVADADRTYIAYEVKGIPVPDHIPDDGCLSMMPFLQLPDGDKLEVSGGGDTGGMGGQAGETMTSEVKVYYPAISLNVEKIIITFPCILPEGTGPENWQIPLALVPAPEGFVTPAVEVGATFVAAGPKFDVAPTPTSEPELTPFQYDPSFPNTPTPVPNGSGLYLEQVIELPDSYILVGNFADVGDLPGYFLATDSAYDYVPRIEDGDGNPVVLKIRDDIKPVVAWASVHYWAYEVAKPVQGPLKITLDQIDIMTTSTVRFDFDSGPNPQPGQEWQLDLPNHLGRYDYVVDSVQMIGDGYVVKFHSGTDVPEGTSFLLDIVGSSQERGPNSAEEDRRSPTIVKYSENITYLVPPPTGLFTFALTLSETVPLKGPWTLTWMPPSK